MRNSRTLGRALRAVLLCAACALAAAAHASGRGQKPTSFLDGSVTFKLPDGWSLNIYTDTDKLGGGQLTILYLDEALGKGNVSVFLTAMPAPDYKNMREASDMLYLRQHAAVPEFTYPDSVVLSDTFDGAEWRTLAFKATVRGTPRLMLERVGLVNHKRVNLGVTLPSDGLDPELLKRTVEDFNAACENLKVEGRNQFDAKLDPDKLSEHLKADEKK